MDSFGLVQIDIRFGWLQHQPIGAFGCRGSPQAAKQTFSLHVLRWSGLRIRANLRIYGSLSGNDRRKATTVLPSSSTSDWQGALKHETGPIHHGQL